eukprot:1055323-Pelagomonas_calceolata.AAC.5
MRFTFEFVHVNPAKIQFFSTPAIEYFFLAAENHLVGVGAVVRGGKNQFQDPDSYMPTGAGIRFELYASRIMLHPPIALTKEQAPCPFKVGVQPQLL